MQPPTIYRLLGDKEALLNAVAEYELDAYVTAKRDKLPHPDPVEELRRGWDRHVAFGIANPGLFRIMSSIADSPAAVAGLNELRQRIHAIALAGRLQGSEERAAAMVHAACAGAVLALLTHKSNSQLDLSAKMREVIISAITSQTVGVQEAGLSSIATTLRARLGLSRALTVGERALLEEILMRMSDEIQ